MAENPPDSSLISRNKYFVEHCGFLSASQLDKPSVLSQQPVQPQTVLVVGQEATDQGLDQMIAHLNAELSPHDHLRTLQMLE